MGCCKSIHLNPKKFMVNYNENVFKNNAEGIIMIDTPELTKEAIEVLAKSFCGNENSRPEMALNWILGPRYYDAFDFNDDVGQKRLKFFMDISKWVMTQCQKYGGYAFAFIDRNENKMKAIALIYPSLASHLGMLCFICLALNVGKPCFIAEPHNFDGVEARFEQFEEIGIHETFYKDHGEHWYVHCFGTHVDHQKKGFGRKFLRFITDLANANSIPVFLECTSYNMDFYKKCGFQEYFSIDAPEPRHELFQFLGMYYVPTP